MPIIDNDSMPSGTSTPETGVAYASIPADQQPTEQGKPQPATRGKTPGKRSSVVMLVLGALSMLFVATAALIIYLVYQDQNMMQIAQYSGSGGDVVGHFILIYFPIMFFYFISLLLLFLTDIGLGAGILAFSVRGVSSTREPRVRRRFLVSMVLGAIGIDAMVCIAYAFLSIFS